MKIIDLLNKIANSEEIPKSFVYNSEIYSLGDDGRYKEFKDGNYLIDVIRYDFKNLNDEIIEKDEKIEMLSLLNELYTYNMTEEFNHLIRKIDEIIKHINKGD